MIKNGKRIVQKTFKIILISFAVLYVALCVTAYFLQDHIVFFRQKLLNENVSALARADTVENIELKMKDGIKIKGWLVKNVRGGKSNLLIYFGANAEEVSYLIPRMSKFKGWSVALLNYRGYGASEGMPGEKELFSDSVEIYDYFAGRDDIDKSKIAVMGRSIGTGVATYLAEQRSVKSVVLVTPYETLTSVAKEKLPFLPVGLLFKYHFDSISRAPSIHSHLLMLVGNKDTLIPNWHSEKLAKAWGGPVQYEVIDGAGHNTIDDGENYWNMIDNFLAG